MLQVRDALPGGINHIFQCDGDLLPESLLDLSQPKFYRHGCSVEPSIFGCVITMPTLRRIILEVGNDEFSFSHLSGVLEKIGASKRKIMIL